MPTVELEAAEILERSADDRGRVRLGPAYQGETVRVAVVEVVESDENQQ